MAIIVYEFDSQNGSLNPVAAMSDGGMVRSNNEYLKAAMDEMEEAEVISRFDNGITYLVQQYNDNVAKKIWNRWGRNNDN